MPRTVQILLGVLITALIVVLPWRYYYLQQKKMRNFRVVQEGVLYRSGQLSPQGLKQAIKEHGIKTVVTLRDGSNRDDQEEEAFCRSNGMRFVRIVQTGWTDTTNGTNLGDDRVDQFLQVMNDPSNYPVLVHCYKGVHRTGVYCALFRMEYQNWTGEEAIQEMLLRGYDAIHEERDVHTYLTRYRPKRSASRAVAATQTSRSHP